MVEPTKDGLTGSGTVTVGYGAHNATAAVDVTVAKFAHLAVRATPEPAYPGSSRVEVTQVSRVACTSPRTYQRARLVVWMQLTNGALKMLPPDRTTISVAAATGVASVVNNILAATVGEPLATRCAIDCASLCC